MFQFTSYFAVLTLMLTPKYNRALIVLIPFMIAFCKPVFGLLDNKYVSPILLFGLMIIMALTSFREKKRVCLAAIAVTQMSLSVESILCSLCVYDILGYIPTEIYPHTWATIVYTVTLDIILWITFAFLIIVWNKLLKRKNVKSLGYFWLFPVGQILFFWSCLFRLWQDIDDYLFTNPYLIAAVVFSFVSDILMYRVLKENSRVQDMKQTISELEREMEMQLRYYDTLEAQYIEIREYKHDIRNLIASVKALSAADGADGDCAVLLDEMEKRADKMSIPVYCSDPLVNSVLWQKSAAAEKKNVKFSVIMDMSERLGMERIDTCSLLVNILDNAIDEAAKYDGGRVTLTVSRRIGLLFIEAANTTKKVISPDKKMPLTEKDGDHGHGSDIIRRIVGKYNGNYILTADGKTARAMISLSDA